MKRLACASLIAVLFANATASAAEQDLELQAAIAECNAALETLARGKSAYPGIGIVYNWPALFQLLDSGNPHVRRAAADTLAKLAWWNRSLPSLRDLRKHLEQDSDPYVRAAALIFLLPSAVKDLKRGIAPDYVVDSRDEKLNVVAPVFKELMTSSTTPPYVEIILRFKEGTRVLSRLIPEHVDHRKLLARRVIHATEKMIATANSLSEADLPKRTFKNMTVARKKRAMDRFREQDHETAKETLYNFAIALPDVFWGALVEHVSVTSSVDFRRFLIDDFLPTWLHWTSTEDARGLKQAHAVLGVLSADWDKKIAALARQKVQAIKTQERHNK